MKDGDPLQRCNKGMRNVKGKEKTWYVWDEEVKMVLGFEIWTVYENGWDSLIQPLPKQHISFPP